MRKGGESVFRKDLLIGKIKANGLTYINVAQNMGVTTQTLRNKMRQGNFGAEEIRVLVKTLGLTDTELLSIFFDREINQ